MVPGSFQWRRECKFLWLLFSSASSKHIKPLNFITGGQIHWAIEAYFAAHSMTEPKVRRDQTYMKVRGDNPFNSVRVISRLYLLKQKQFFGNCLSA
jgi:hypothetical protein